MSVCVCVLVCVRYTFHTLKKIQFYNVDVGMELEELHSVIPTRD